MEQKHERELSLAEASQIVRDLHERIASAVFGQNDLITEALICFLSSGHLLMTGAPGLAKTTLVRVIARFLNLRFGRVQFTPDLLPSDIIGSEILNIDQASGERVFRFAPGPIFTNLLLADEINRASPRTQSALLEAMQERSSTVAGHVHQLPSPFMVFATQNPFESEGTFPLPEAQLDRFLIHALVSYPTEEAELRILQEHALSKLVGEAKSDSVLSREQASALDMSTIAGLLSRVRSIRVDDELLKVMNELVRATRPDNPSCPDNLRNAIWYGAGPRAGISLVSAARAYALISQSETVRWNHVKRVAKPVLRHRIRLAAQALRDQLTEDMLIEKLLTQLEDKYSLLAQGIP